MSNMEVVLEESGTVYSSRTGVSDSSGVEKINKPNICIYSKHLNRALKRSHYPMVTIGEILHRLKNKCIYRF
jgi:hypothetical protein